MKEPQKLTDLSVFYLLHKFHYSKSVGNLIFCYMRKNNFTVLNKIKHTFPRFTQYLHSW